MMQRRRLLVWALSGISAALVLLVWLYAYADSPRAPVMSVSVSGDGLFAISVHRDTSLVLWDLASKDNSRIADDANLYSAHFPADGHVFLWQDMENVVRRQHVDGSVLETFAHVPTYGHVSTADDSVYVSSDERYAIRVRLGQETHLLKREGGSFPGFGKVLNLAMDREGRYLVTGGFGSPHDRDHWPLDEQAEIGYEDLVGTVLWSLETLEPIAKLSGNTAKTHATISPDGQWVVSGDENGIGLYWNTDRPEERFRMASYFHGLFLGTHEPGDPRNRDRSGLIPAPDDATDTTIAVKFIHNSRYYLRFGYDSHYAALFEVDNPWPLKYFDLGKRPFPAVSQYSRNLAIDTAPEAGILVMGQRDGSGILVYRFDPEALTLERVWVGR